VLLCNEIIHAKTAFKWLKDIKSHMYKILISLFGTLLLGNMAHKNVQTPSATLEFDHCSIENSCFEGGEKLTYKVYYNWNFIWLSAGEVSFYVKDLGTGYELTALGKTYPSYEWFYKVDDRYYSYVDKECLLPKKFTRDIKEGNYYLYDKVKFDQDNKSGISMRGRTKETVKLEEFELDNCVHDLLSILYYTRNVNMNEMNSGEKFPVNLYLDLEVYPLEIALAERQKNKKIKGLGHFDVIKLNPELIEGHVFDEDQTMDIWVSDDMNRIPLLIESPLSVGSAKAVLSEYQGLRHSLGESR